MLLHQIDLSIIISEAIDSNDTYNNCFWFAQIMYLLFIIY